MSHITGAVQTVSPQVVIGPDSGPATGPANTWTQNFAHVPAATGTKLLILHFTDVKLPASNRLEVDLGYDTDVFTSADGGEFWTRPVNIYVLPGGLVPIRYITDGATTGSVKLDKYGRGESHAGETGHPSISNSDPFMKDATYAEPTYDPFWYCSNPPSWENVACVTAPGDVRARVARSVGMIVSVEGDNVSTCSVTLVDADKVITAGHCHTPAQALTSSITFDYQTTCSGARPSGYSAKFHKVKSVIKHKYDSGGDFSLLQLATAPPGIPAIQMRHDLPAPGEQIFGIHHPNGAVKKLSVPHPGFDTVLSSSAASVTVPTNFHVSGGSSGSGLFDAAGRIVGVLSQGDPCGGGHLSYFPTASILGAIAPVPPPPITRDVMVVVDRSGSMSDDDGTGRTKIEAARDAVSLFVQLVRSGVGNRAGLVSFSTSASSPIDFAISSVTDPHKKTLVGPAPFSGGIVGALSPGGATSIGDGLEKARLQFPVPGSNPRAILLMTDGMQNTPPTIADISGALSGIDIHAVGFGTDATLDGAVLTSLTTAHGGLYTRADSGLALEKFFSHAFGNIFEAGILMDPDYVLAANEFAAKAQSFAVCGEDTVTVVLGWDRTDAQLFLEVTTPGGASITAGTPGVVAATGRSWAFLRIPLPHAAERDGTWSVTVFRPRGGGEFPPPAPEVRYFINVIPTGGPVLTRVPDERRYYTGDSINPLVMLRYADGTWPDRVEAEVTVTRPIAGVGNILSGKGLQGPVSLNGDTIPARQATLRSLEQQSGQPVVGHTLDTFVLVDDSASTGGTFEPAAVLGMPFDDLLAMEGNYTFHFKARYGEACVGTRELLGSLHVDVGIDPDHTGITTTVGGEGPGGKEVVLTITPQDKYGNKLGPGRAGDISVTGGPGTVVTGPSHDNGDGSYTVPGTWDPASGQSPGLVIGQPGRPPVSVHDPKTAPTPHCAKWKRLCLALCSLALLLFCGRRRRRRSHRRCCGVSTQCSSCGHGGERRHDGERRCC